MGGTRKGALSVGRGVAIAAPSVPWSFPKQAPLGPSRMRPTCTGPRPVFLAAYLAILTSGQEKMRPTSLLASCHCVSVIFSSTEMVSDFRQGWDGVLCPGHVGAWSPVTTGGQDGPRRFSRQHLCLPCQMSVTQRSSDLQSSEHRRCCPVMLQCSSSDQRP